jgi:sialate O-acetylesterase
MRPSIARNSACLALLLAASQIAQAITLPNIIGSNMVLQRGQPVPIWGWASPGEKVTVEFAGQKRTATTDATGRWEVRLKSLKASSAPADLTITGADKLTLTNILVGEVWLCSGQSNMEKPIGDQPGQKPTRNYREELSSGNQFPKIRFFKATKTALPQPTNNVKGSWSVCSSNSLGAVKLTAVGYFFGRDLHTNLNVPIGLIESSWGGTRIEPWTPPAGFQQNSKLAEFLLPTTNKLSSSPMALYNGMIAPLVPFAIRGALWYQGESNCGDDNTHGLYADKMEALIRGWRTVWNQGNFSFYYVQLAPFHYYYDIPKPRVANPDALPIIWECQTDAQHIPNTGMAVITDLVENLKDIHPTQKLEVGQRLARIALAKNYGKDTVYSGPTFKRLKIRGGKAVLSFDNLAGGLVAKDGQPLTWFTIAGADGKFVPAKAEISGKTVVVTSPEVAQPKAVRFAWHEAAQPNLFNQAGLPATPFRTDHN